MVRRQRLVALVAVVVMMAAAVSGWSVTAAPPASATNPPGVGWGSNGEGQLGIGLAPNATSPTTTSLGQRPAQDPFIQVSVGQSSACGVTQSGSAYCWGDGSTGALGSGTSAVSNVPIQVAQGARQADDTFVSVAVGTSFACGLTGRSKAFCWGTNSVGQLGSGNTNDSASPVAVAGSLEFRSLAVNTGNGCGLATNDSVYCWGSNFYRELGGGSVNNYETVPVRASGGALAASPPMASVAVGQNHVCATSAAQTAYCWGMNLQGSLGVPGVGPSAPVAVSGSMSFTSVVAGEYVTCAVSTDDSAYCWGSNSYGTLGNGGWSSADSPQQVVTGGVLSGQRVSALSMFANSVCARTASGGAACWGFNSNGQLGDGTTVNANAPVAVLDGSKPGADAWSSVSAGTFATCGVASGNIYCWGARGAGQLGNGTWTTAPSTLEMVSGQMPYAVSFQSIDAGTYTGCGVGTDAWVYCWGQGQRGGLGNGTATTAYSPRAIVQGALPGGTSFSAVSTGLWYACGRTTLGALYCWGWNNSGQLGNATFDDTNVPTMVVTGAKPGADSWTSVSAGREFACGISSAGGLFCWGANNNGQLGLGNRVNQSQPQVVSGSWKHVTAGSSHSCAIANDDSTYCWGWNGNGQLGTGNNTSYESPRLVSTANLAPGEVFRQLALGPDNTCGVTSAKRILCWGLNAYGQLGNATAVSSSVPVPVSNPVGVSGTVEYTAVTAGPSFACGLAATGSAYCWGYNSSGQLGDGTLANRSSPVAVTGQGVGRLTAISAGDYAVSAVLALSPASPTLTSAITTQTAATISFTPGAGGPTVTNYEYSLDGGAWIALSPQAAASPVTIPGLTAATTYSVRLRAVSGNLTGDASNALSVTTQSAPGPAPGPVPATPPGAPTDVVATPGDRSVTVRWAAPADLGSPVATRYEVESTPSGVACTTSGTTCVVSGLRNGTEYAFRVRALSESAMGAWSAWTSGVVPRGVPSSPTAVVAVAGDQSARLTWQAPADDGGSPIVGYTVRATPGEASCTVLALSCAMTGLTNGTPYTFTVVATNAVGSSLPSNPSNAVTPKSSVEPSIVITGSRADRTPRDKVTIIGTTTGLIGAEAQAWVKPLGRSEFAARGEPLLIGESQRFRWTGTIRRAAQVYFTAGDVRSNKITLPRR